MQWNKFMICFKHTLNFIKLTDCENNIQQYNNYHCFLLVMFELKIQKLLDCQDFHIKQMQEFGMYAAEMISDDH